MNTISISEASRRAGISRPAIRKHLKVGRIESVDGKVVLSSFERWLKDRESVSEENNEESVQGPVFGDLKDAERHKTSYEARLKEIEYDIKSKQVILIEEAVDLVSMEYSRVRTRLLAIPAESSPQLFNCKTVMEIQDKLSRLINRVLEELSADVQLQQKISEGEELSSTSTE